MKNKISDLNNHLFSQLERLSDEDLKGDELKEEIERSKAVKAIAQEIISGGKLALEAQLELGGVKSAPEMLEVKNS
ncbi:hypothetical protein JG635_09345 [Vibrio cholerae]|uniref:hypothetical protein n=1 Tax=Vibrio cholerae TaxID=666 RepID=UPI0018F09D46|nr:hypothetical protein [Vibrio cholerae]MBJ6971805.1 hypothetical protein [Vibrio cholerae]